MIDKNSRIPIYYQLEESIKQQVASGELKPGDSIPSEREYCAQFGISRMTVRQAISNLVAEGILFRQKGKGTFVAAQKVEQELFGLTGFTEDMIERGMMPGSRLLSFGIVPAMSGIASKLGISEGSPVYELKRVRLADGLPMAVETAYIPEQLVPGLTESVQSSSVYRYIEEQLGLAILDASQEIEASPAGKEEAFHLGIPEGSPVLWMTRTSRLEGGTVFEYVESAFRADRYKFVHTLRRSGK